MSNAGIVLSKEVIERTIKENNYIPDNANNHITTEEFQEMYGLETLKSYEEGRELLYFLFGIRKHNENSLTYSLENNSRITTFFGVATPGYNTTKILNYTKGSWKNYQRVIDENEAITIAYSVRNALVNVLENISENSDATEVRSMLETQQLKTKQNWLKKYLTVLYPEKFMPMLNSDWTSRIFIPLGLTPSGDWFDNAKAFSKKAKDFGVDSVALYHIVYKCATEQIKCELTELGIDTSRLGAVDNLLVNTKGSFDGIKKHIESEDLQTRFEEYLSNRYNWDSKTKTTTGTVDASNNATAYISKYTQRILNAKNTIFRGAPGTGKSYLAKEIAAFIVSGGATGNFDNLFPEQKKQVEFVQFHPSYDYSDFVEGLRPIKSKKGVDFKLEPGTFKNFVNTAKENLGKPFVFIIDEINRGEISKIFGELFYSVEPSKRGTAGEISTQYANMHPDEPKFYIPENVYIIGTMNDIDRSVDTFDFAMRRRFTFIEITAEESQRMLDGIVEEQLKEEVKVRMNSLNAAISKDEYGLNPNYYIGAAYFIDIKDESDFESLWTDKLKPLLQEYVVGLYNAAAAMADFENAYFSKTAGTAILQNDDQGVGDENDQAD